MPVQTYTLKVVEIRNETSDSVTICFKQPGLKKVKYVAGQYLTLIFRINGRRYIRPYSFSSAPGVDQLLEVTVKRVPGGVVSNHIADQVKEGDMVEVMEAMGDFTFTPDHGKHVVLWGAGSGITPLFSLAKFVLSAYPDFHVTLVYGNRSHESVIFQDKIGQLAIAYPERLSLWHFYTQLTIDERNPYVVQGRIAPDKVLDVMRAEGDLANTVHYVCGPAGLKESVKSALSALGVASDRVFSEDFELVKDPKDFEDVVTSIVDIARAGERKLVEVVKGKSILEAGLDAQIELMYSCQTGNCTVCKGTLTGGEVKMVGVKERPADLLDNEYLLCCTYPLSTEVQVEI